MLLQNDGVLPLAAGTKLNVFGWASTNPMLGGGGSGALNTAYESVSLLQSLNDAGIETNTELSDFYTSYKADRPVCGMWAQDWTLPEPNVSKYSADMMANAKAFSGTAMIVISRPGGEGADTAHTRTAQLTERRLTTTLSMRAMTGTQAITICSWITARKKW